MRRNSLELLNHHKASISSNMSDYSPLSFPRHFCCLTCSSVSDTHTHTHTHTPHTTHTHTHTHTHIHTHTPHTHTPHTHHTHTHTRTLYLTAVYFSTCGSGCDIVVPRNRLGSLLNWYECHIELFKNSDEFGNKCSMHNYSERSVCTTTTLGFYII